MRVDHYSVPGLSHHEDRAFSDADVQGWLLAAIEQETNSQKRHMLNNAAALMERVMDELQTYRDAAQFDFDRPRSMQFRGWNMGKLAEALRKTQAA